jgi:hypothetical protein
MMTPPSQRCTLKSTFKTFGNHKMFGSRSGFLSTHVIWVTFNLKTNKIFLNIQRNHVLFDGKHIAKLQNVEHGWILFLFLYVEHDVYPILTWHNLYVIKQPSILEMHGRNGTIFEVDLLRFYKWKFLS